MALHNQEAQEIPAGPPAGKRGPGTQSRQRQNRNVKLALDGSHLPVDSSMRTAVYGVFAAGNFVAYPGKGGCDRHGVAEGGPPPLG